MSQFEDRQMILCAQDLPVRCVHCDRHLPERQNPSLMMINAEGEAVVCSGPVVFCTQCPAAYAPESHFAAIAASYQFNPYSLVGFLDWSLLPEDQRQQELDSEAEIPLVPFASMDALQPARFD